MFLICDYSAEKVGVPLYETSGDIIYLFDTRRTCVPTNPKMILANLLVYRSMSLNTVLVLFIMLMQVRIVFTDELTYFSDHINIEENTFIKNILSTLLKIIAIKNCNEWRIASGRDELMTVEISEQYHSLPLPLLLQSAHHDCYTVRTCSKTFFFFCAVMFKLLASYTATYTCENSFL